ncbi:hypothetical protein L596_028051 [Steinernema carpocapsae]|uniref:IBB domain-containing protein n=1 Tax=Steinernema carpocapsae TaxID=34508 RepID=A0A4U5LXA7_STECR|nr:hypothetical protein L596_028051 [Steinernema carpocapsae]
MANLAPFVASGYKRCSFALQACKPPPSVATHHSSETSTFFQPHPEVTGIVIPRLTSCFSDFCALRVAAIRVCLFRILQELFVCLLLTISRTFQVPNIIIFPETTMDDQDRQKMYKNAGRHEDLRRRRTECSVELRKQKREDARMKRRNVILDTSDLAEESSNEGPATTPMSLEDILQCLKNNPGIPELERSFEALRRFVSHDKAPPVDEVIRLGLVEAMVSALAVEHKKIQFEAAWALTNIVSGTSEQTQHAVDRGCLQPLVKLCYSDDLKLAEQAAWALANVTGDSASMRDQVVAAGGLDALGHLTRKVGFLRTDFVRTVAWWYSNMCRHKCPQAAINILRNLAHGLAILATHEDTAVRVDVFWAFSYMTDGPDEQIVLPCEVGALESIDDLLGPAIRILGNFASGADDLTQILLDNGYIAKFVPKLLETGRSSIVKETMWLVSNIFAGTQKQIQYLIDLGIVPLVKKVFGKGDSKGKLEASWALSNLVQGGSSAQIFTIIKDDGFSDIEEGLRGTSQVDTIINILDTVLGVLEHLDASGHEAYDGMLEKFEETGCLDIVEAYQQHGSEEIYKRAFKIVERHFAHDEKENLAPDYDDDTKVPEGGFKF